MYKKRVLLWCLLGALSLISFINAPEVLGASKTLKILMINWRAEKVTSQGFKDGLKELGYDVEYEEFVADQQMDKLSHFLRSDFTPQNYEYIYTFGTSASKRTHGALKGTTPQIFTMVSFPVESGLVESLDEPGTNCTGVTHLVPLELQMQTALDLFKFKTLLMVFNPRELNSKLTREKMVELSKAYQFDFTSLRAVSQSTLQEALGKIRSGEVKADIVYLPSDSMITTHIDFIVKEFLEMKQLHFSALTRDVERGALLGLANDYYKTGKAAAFLVDQNQKGTPMAEIPVKRFDSPTIFINKKTADFFGFEIPDELKSRVQFIEE